MGRYRWVTHADCLRNSYSETTTCSITFGTIITLRHGVGDGGPEIPKEEWALARHEHPTETCDTLYFIAMPTA